MYPPIFSTLYASSAVKALIGTTPMRCYLAGEATQGVALPYVTWQTIGAAPENYLNDRPNMDGYAVQVDVWADTATSSRATASAIRTALEPVAYIGALRESKDPDTNHYRYSLDVDFLTPR